MLNKSTQAKNWLGAIDSIKQINQLYDNTAKGISDASKFQQNYNAILKNSNSTFIEYSKTVNQGSQSLGGYVKYLTTSTARTILLTAKTVILQTAISAGLTLFFKNNLSTRSLPQPSGKLSLKTPNNPPKGSYFGIKTFLISGKLKGDMLKPLSNQSKSYSKATTISGVLASVPTKISL